MNNLGFKFKREGNLCERCKKEAAEVGKMAFYEEYDLWCCDKCIKETIDEKNLKCPKCKRVAYEHGGMSGYGDEPPFEFMCLECVEKKEAREAKRNAIKLTIKNFAKDHWKFWIMLVVGIIAIVVSLYI